MEDNLAFPARPVELDRREAHVGALVRERDGRVMALLAAPVRVGVHLGVAVQPLNEFLGGDLSVQKLRRLGAQRSPQGVDRDQLVRPEKVSPPLGFPQHAA